MARRDFAANMDDPDAAALIVADWIIGGGSGLSNRLADRLPSEGRSLVLGLQHDRSEDFREPRELDRSRDHGAAEPCACRE